MPRQVDYPRRSLHQSLELAGAVDSLGGSCSEEMAANWLGRTGASGGAFNALIAAAVKFGVVESRKKTLATTPLYREFKLAYNDEQRIHALRSAFLSVPVFRRVYERFLGKSIPVDILDKLLIREFAVPEAVAARVGEYFLEGARRCKLLDDAGVLVDEASGATSSSSPPNPDVPPAATVAPQTEERAGCYVIRITGPGISSSIEVGAEDDLRIVDAVLSRIRRSLTAQET
jgi:hypothetical protein